MNQVQSLKFTEMQHDVKLIYFNVAVSNNSFFFFFVSIILLKIDIK